MARPIFLGDVLRNQLANLVALGVLLVFWAGSILFLALNILLIPWYRLWRGFGIWNLVALRFVMRMRNLIDTSATVPPTEPRTLKWQPSFRYQRTADGRFNDLSAPLMGAAGTRFGRNFPLSALKVDDQNLVNPNPRDVSLKLLRRDRFRPAASLNLLAAAWIQFQVHDWFNHKRSTEKLPPIPLTDDHDPFPVPECANRTMAIRRTLKDERYSGDPENVPMFCNTETHWWDGSQLYGSDRARQLLLRKQKGGHLKVFWDRNDWRLLPNTDPDMPGIDLTGFNHNYWVGLSLLHTVFALEHNAICDQLQGAYPDWDDDRLFETARLINVAVMAKIHTVEWTPAILGHPTLLLGMRANWNGIRLLRSIGRSPLLRALQEELSGIPGSGHDHHAAPYYMTEEFVSVYRMHPLIPDDYRFYSVKTDELQEEQDFTNIQANGTRPFMNRFAMEDLFYSFGVACPGALTLHNFPRALQQFHRLKDENGPAGGETLDLAAVDIMRDRERAVPRYNQFRKLLLLLPTFSYRRLVGLPLLPWFTGLTKREQKERKEWAQELKRLYPRRKLLDLMVGLYAEHKPKGFGFSDTAFRIFILMASRRLKSDRFFTDDFKPEVYTEIGLKWIEDNGLKSVLQRHYPALDAALAEVDNPFSPWPRVGQPAPEPVPATPFDFSIQPILAGTTLGAILGPVVNVLLNWSTGALLLPTLIYGALWGAAIGGAFGGVSMAILHAWSDWVSGKLTAGGRVAIAYLLAVFFAVGTAALQPTDPNHPLSSLPWDQLAKAAGFGGLLGLAVLAIIDLSKLFGSGTGVERLSLFGRSIVIGATGAIISTGLGTFVGWAIGNLVSVTNTSLMDGHEVSIGFDTFFSSRTYTGAGIGFLLGFLNRNVLSGVRWAIAGWLVGALVNVLSATPVVQEFRIGIDTFLNDRTYIGAAIGAAIGSLMGFVNRSVLSGVRWTIAGWLVDVLVSVLWGMPTLLDGIKASVHTDHALYGAGIGALIGMIAWIIWPLYRWSLRRDVWNVIAWMTFMGNKPLEIACPKPNSQKITPVFLSDVFPTLKVSDPRVPHVIKVADIIPKDEKVWRLTHYLLKRVSFPFMRVLSRIFSPMQSDLPPIAQDPMETLDQAYRGLRRRQYDSPEIPPEFEGSPDLGGLAVRGPYACYTAKIREGEMAGKYEWNLLDLNDPELEYRPGVYKLGVKVLFREVSHPQGVKLEAYQIDSACGCSHPGDQNWQLAKKLVLCALANHMSLVRHWNWIHLTPTAHLAIATRNHLPSTHPLCRLLWPHVFGTQQSNYFGTLSQMTGADFGEIFSFTFEGMCRLFQKTHREYRFITTDPCQDARERGIDAVAFKTPTQDNLKALFTVMSEHAEFFVNRYYQNDMEVQQDQHVQAWHDQLNELIPGKTGVATGSLTRATLANLIARFIYLVTAQHESVGAMLWNYQLWSHRQPVRVYQDGRREPLDVYQLLVNYNYLLNVKRTLLIPEKGDYSYLAEGLGGTRQEIVASCFKDFNDKLKKLQQNMEKEPWAVWKIYPKDLEAHINA